MPKGAKKAFNEARLVVNSTPKAASAMLRTCLSILLKELGESGKDLNDDVLSLVSKGLHPGVHQSLEKVDAIGLNAIQSGQINDSDTLETASQLAQLINIIVNGVVTQPKLIENLNSTINENKRRS